MYRFIRRAPCSELAPWPSRRRKNYAALCSRDARTILGSSYVVGFYEPVWYRGTDSFRIFSYPIKSIGAKRAVLFLASLSRGGTRGVKIRHKSIMGRIDKESL